MDTPRLQTKLYIPPPRPNFISRPRLIAQLNVGLPRKLTLISAPAGFGKTTLVSSWLDDLRLGATKENQRINYQSDIKHQFAWLALDERDNDPMRFLSYFIAALQTVVPTLGEGIVSLLQSPQPPPIELMLTTLLNELSASPDKPSTGSGERFILVLDDYHVIQSPAVDQALTFLLEHLPPQLHLVITTREDPNLPLARYRVRDQLTELRATDLRFTLDEAAEFLNQTMGLTLSAENIAALDTRTEGWIAGLQLAALALQKPLSMEGHQDPTDFIKSFTGSHHFVLDYLLEEVLHQQPENIQKFLLQTAILDRLCGPLCDAVLGRGNGARFSVAEMSSPASPNLSEENIASASPLSGQATLEYLQQANLFIVPLDNERRWYRYHHLFADLLRQRLQQRTPLSTGDKKGNIAELHIRASQWYEENDLALEAFQHAAKANDLERAERLIEGQGMPLYFRGVVSPVLQWLELLPATALNARPSLGVMYASVLTLTGQASDIIEQTLQTAEDVLQETEPDGKTRNLIGQIAALRAMLSIPQNQIDIIIAQSRRALEFLHPDNLAVRTSANWTLGFACQLRGDRLEAGRAYTEAIATSQASGNIMITFAAATCLGQVRETENQLHLAAESYRHVLALAGEPPWPTACEAYLGLARVCYQWNDLTTAEQHAQQALNLAQQVENVDTPASCWLFLARLKLAQGDVAGATAMLTAAEQFLRQRNFAHRLPELAEVQVLILLQQNNLVAAARLAEKHDLPLSRARVHLAQEDPATALTVSEPVYQEMVTKVWVDEQLKVMVLQVIALQAKGEQEQALQRLDEALALAQPGGFIRLFVDEGTPMAKLLREAVTCGMRPGYTGKLLAAFESASDDGGQKRALSPSPWVEPLSQRELEVLQLLALGLSNREIGERLFLALDTVKGHNRRIYGKLQVQRRTQAVARARELGLL